MSNLLKRLFRKNSPNTLPLTNKPTEPVIGWRSWWLTDNLELKSAVMNTVWPFRKPLWSYNYSPNREGTPHGIYAWRDQGRSQDYAGACYGSVYLWGRVAEHTDGYLAEYAYPKALYLPRDSDPVRVLQLEENYGVSCEMVEDWVVQKDDYSLLPMPNTATMIQQMAQWQQQMTAQQMAQVYFSVNPYSYIPSGGLFGGGK